MVTFQRSERRNALSIAMMRCLVEILETLEQDPAQRVVLLRGAGPVFCAGLDLAEASNASLARESAEYVAKTLHTLRRSSLISIACVQGGAYAGGAGVVAACDMAIATTSSQFAFPEARRGLLPALISDVLRTKVREGDLAELFLVGNPITATRAQQIGLIQQVVTEEALEETAMEMVDGILQGGPQTIRDTKMLLRQLFGHADGTHHSLGESLGEHLRARGSDEAMEGLRAFLEKRKPSWNLS